MMPDLKTYKQHFENKHPKAVMPKELQEVGKYGALSSPPPLETPNTTSVLIFFIL